MLPILWSLLVAMGVVLADQAAKRSVAGRFDEGERRTLVGGVALARVINRRGGVVRLSTPASVVVAVGLAAWTVVVLAQPGVGGAAALGLGLLVGGVASNVADRIRHGGVVDLIAVGWWPVFNLADAAIVAGALVVLASVVAGAIG
ncbi:hypothetical protein BH10ACT1_BH10ACT1_13020 [soil metagenome]